MAPKILITGGTGYIGGTVLDTLVKQHPEYEITALLRNLPSNFTALYPNVKVVRGDYDSWDAISDAASKADVVVHNDNSDHEPSIKAIVAGLLKLADWKDAVYHGKLNPKTWNHGGKLKTAIVCPPDIYGPGRGPGNTASVFLSAFFDEIVGTIGAPFYGGEGTNTRSWVHIEDLVQLYSRLIEAAVAGVVKRPGELRYVAGSEDGDSGYYFAASQEHSQRGMAEKTAAVIKKHELWPLTEIVQVSLEVLDGSMQGWGIPHIGTYMFAANSRPRADRAAKELGYVPSAPSLLDVIEHDLLVAAQKKQRTFAGVQIK
ncbi:hypothetical protein DOTSEDRAFT_89648 [Dothistroma septosporum NZE10]|uniref:NAD-dependent epimerase/dehydratase domain-containing protein n=1 Tax=Dothistroma septosporum (strain NZE10 / CBS 128990) TaxID=675120 RepID=N1PIK7_DOTSN|nr:hypothetical protein DOTSEDRAFT_89648 [Dothistroma septosporum NZE10]